MTQQDFASLLSLSFVSVNKWENGGSSPTGLSEVLLGLLASVLRYTPAAVVVAKLRAAGPNALDLVRTLVAMEKQHA